MASFEEGLRRLQVLAVRREEREPAPAPLGLDPHAVRGQVYRGGELVRDKVTGQGGSVEYSGFVHSALEATGRGGD